MRVIPNNKITANFLYDLCEKLQGYEFDTYNITMKNNVVEIELNQNIKDGEYVKIGTDYAKVKKHGKIITWLEWIIRGEKKITDKKELTIINHVHNIRRCSRTEIEHIENIMRKHRWDKVGKRAAWNEDYYCILDGKIVRVVDLHKEVDDLRYYRGNYFMTEKAAQKELNRINSILC